MARIRRIFDERVDGDSKLYGIVQRVFCEPKNDPGFRMICIAFRMQICPTTEANRERVYFVAILVGRDKHVPNTNELWQRFNDVMVEMRCDKCFKVSDFLFSTKDIDALDKCVEPTKKNSKIKPGAGWKDEHCQIFTDAGIPWPLPMESDDNINIDVQLMSERQQEIVRFCNMMFEANYAAAADSQEKYEFLDVNPTLKRILPPNGPLPKLATALHCDFIATVLHLRRLASRLRPPPPPLASCLRRLRPLRACIAPALRLRRACVALASRMSCYRCARLCLACAAQLLRRVALRMRCACVALALHVRSAKLRYRCIGVDCLLQLRFACVAFAPCLRGACVACAIALSKSCGHGCGCGCGYDCRCGNTSLVKLLRSCLCKAKVIAMEVLQGPDTHRKLQDRHQDRGRGRPADHPVPPWLRVHGRRGLGPEHVFDLEGKGVGL